MYHGNFMHLKSVLPKCRPTILYGLWKAVQKEWAKITSSKTTKGVFSMEIVVWKLNSILRVSKLNFKTQIFYVK